MRPTEVRSDWLSPPTKALPDPSKIVGPVAVDTEGSGLFPDVGAYVCAASVAYRTEIDGPIFTHAFPFDQGRAKDKGFLQHRLKSGALAGFPSYRGPAKEILLDESQWVDDSANLHESEWTYLLDWLAATQPKGHIYHNAQYDLLMLDSPLRSGTPGRWLADGFFADTMYMLRTLDPLEPAGLKPSAVRAFGEGEDDEKDVVAAALGLAKKIYGIKDVRYDLIPWAANGPYAAQDTALTLRLFDWLSERIDEGDDYGVNIRNVFRYMLALTNVERRGLGPYAAERSHEWANVLAGRIEDLKSKLPFEPTNQRAATYFFDKKGETPWKIGEQARGWEISQDGGRNKVFIPGGKNTPVWKAKMASRFPDHDDRGIKFKHGSITKDVASRIDLLKIKW